MSILLTFSYIHYFQFRCYGMCGSMLVYKTYLACHTFINVSKGQLLNQNSNSRRSIHTVSIFHFGLLKYILTLELQDG